MLVTKLLKTSDILKYGQDLLDCFESNSLIFDSQSPLDYTQAGFIEGFVNRFITGQDSMVVGVFDEKYKSLYSVVIFDNIRFGKKKSCAEVHIATRKVMWRHIMDAFSDILDSTQMTTLYCIIPQIAVPAIRVCKQLGFKKTGYIPDALPYVNCQGEENMYDLQIMTWVKGN